MKTLLKNSEDFKYWLSSYNPQSYYINSWAENEPILYPCIVIYHEQEDFNTFKDIISYEFVYLSDFEITEDPERARIEKTLDKYATYEVEYETSEGWRNRYYVNCSAANVLHHYDVAKKMNCRILYTKE